MPLPPSTSHLDDDEQVVSIEEVPLFVWRVCYEQGTLDRCTLLSVPRDPCVRSKMERGSQDF